MSAVTLQEIADLVAGRLGVPLAEMRGLKSNGRRGNAPPDATDRARQARNVVVVLATRHTRTTYSALMTFFGHVYSGGLHEAMSGAVATAERWIAADTELEWMVEEIERQIDALHERRIAGRDRKAVQA